MNKSSFNPLGQTMRKFRNNRHSFGSPAAIQGKLSSMSGFGGTAATRRLLFRRLRIERPLPTQINWSMCSCRTMAFASSSRTAGILAFSKQVD